MNDPFQEYPGMESSKGKGHPPPFSVVPEPAYYGAVLLGLVLVVWWARRARK